MGESGSLYKKRILARVIHELICQRVRKSLNAEKQTHRSALISLKQNLYEVSRTCRRKLLLSFTVHRNKRQAQVMQSYRHCLPKTNYSCYWGSKLRRFRGEPLFFFFFSRILTRRLLWDGLALRSPSNAWGLRHFRFFS